MSEISIRVEHLSKKYQITVGKYRHDTLRDQISDAISAVFHSNGRNHRQTQTFWALKEVSFEVKKGEVLGVIGRNGAGKSTLLKILSRITPPTSGRAEIHGRIGSLLEVGTGFHGELTGRENVYLSGAILGMRRVEIARRFDEIVAFAEVERFLDTPVKRYSTGMYLRLAFAVAAHLEPEVLLVDEVLAVGDAKFQRKCLGRIRDDARHGRTVLFVSHSMAAVGQLCGRALWLDDGRIRLDGPAQTVVEAYLAEGAELQASRQWLDPSAAPGDDRVRLLAARVLQADGIASIVNINAPLQVEMDYRALRPLENLVVAAQFFNAEGTCLFATADRRPSSVPPGAYRQTLTIPARTFSEGRVVITLQFFPHPSAVLAPHALSFAAVDSDNQEAVRGTFGGAWPGVLRLSL